jgi:hypothetical protein
MQLEHPAGESDDGALRVDFDRRLKLEFHGTRVTSDAGLLAYRELNDEVGLTDLAGAALSECRRGKNTRHLLTGLLRQLVFGRLAGYEDVNDADHVPDGRGHGAPNAVPADTRRHRGVASIAAGAMLSAAAVTGCADCWQRNCVHPSPGPAGSSVGQQSPTVTLATGTPSRHFCR